MLGVVTASQSLRSLQLATPSATKGVIASGITGRVHAFLQIIAAWLAGYPREEEDDRAARRSLDAFVHG
jgi:hypothetical protein